MKQERVQGILKMAHVQGRKKLNSYHFILYRDNKNITGGLQRGLKFKL